MIGRLQELPLIKLFTEPQNKPEICRTRCKLGDETMKDNQNQSFISLSLMIPTNRPREVAKRKFAIMRS